MKEFDGRLAVITGGGTGMGRELARALAREGCHLALCDVSQEAMAETAALCRAEGADGLVVSTHRADVADEADVLAFRDGVAEAHATDRVNLLFNNAGIGGGGSMLEHDRAEWERTFNVCWYGVYYGTRAFLPMLLAAEEGHIVNTASINGVWASLGPTTAHTAYSAAKFAVRGFTEALINDMKLHAPHIGVSVVMPGHIGTEIVANSAAVLGREGMDANRERLHRNFKENAPVSAAEAAGVILAGVRENRWRILIGEDAAVIDAMVRENPEEVYGEPFMDRLKERIEWRLGR